MTTEHFDVLIVGAGLSGIDAAYRLQTRCPGKRFAILEARDAIGGTWDLFRYPGVRSDSDMYTLGFPFHPWSGDKAIADGPAIRDYIRATAARYGIDRRIRFGHRVARADWSSDDARWTLDVEAGGSTSRVTCTFLFMCSGYYDYRAGYTPAFPGAERFGGPLIHPQQWPADLDYAGKTIVVIGSGATAVTLVPALAATAAHVTMLQRSPTYVISMPARDLVSRLLHFLLPGQAADWLARWKNALLAMASYGFARKRPEATKRFLRRRLRKDLDPEEIDRNFTPRYNPWDQRLCLVPDGDLFAAMRAGRASVVTGVIDTLTETGVRLASGETLAADVIVTATGLVMQLLGGMVLSMDGKSVELADSLVYKGMMFSGVPNFALAFGYTNMSWTLKCDLTAQAICELLNHMDARGDTVCTPRQRDPSVQPETMVDFTSGYIARARSLLPRQGTKDPWRVHRSYLRDRQLIRSPVEDGIMEFSKGRQPEPSAV